MLSLEGTQHGTRRRLKREAIAIYFINSKMPYTKSYISFG